MSTKKGKDELSLIEELTRGLISDQRKDLNIIEFIEEVLGDVFNMPLFPQQRAILKAIYNVPLSSGTWGQIVIKPDGSPDEAKLKGMGLEPDTVWDERQILDEWYIDKKTNWRPNEIMLERLNAERALEGKAPRENSEYQEIVLQCGMRCVTGDTYAFFPGKGYQRFDEILPKATDRNIQLEWFDQTIQTRHGVRHFTDSLSKLAESTLRVKTHCGYSLEGALEHPMLVKTPEGLVWKNMESLRVGDLLCIERKPLDPKLFPRTELLTIDLDLDSPVEVIPAKLLQGSHEGIKQLLDGLFQEDSRLEVASPELARQIQILLTGFGTLSNRYEENSRWIVELIEPDYDGLFYDEIASIQEGFAPVYDISVPEVSEYVANGLCSSNSGKSSSVGLIVAYEFYKLITNENPQALLGVPNSSSIYITVLASSERQTLGTIFGYVRSYITGSTFFKTMIDKGEILVKELAIEAPKKNIIIGSGHSKADTLVGRTAIMVSFDELAMFSTDDGRTSNAADVYARVGRATATFPEHAKRVAMSSVKEEGDFMQKLVEDGFKDNPRPGLLVFDLPTFDFNPLRTKDDPVIRSDYERDPVAAARDYENIRPASSYAFINPLVIDAATLLFDEKENREMVIDPMKNGIYRQIDIHRPDPNNMLESRQLVGMELANLRPIDPRFVSVGHADPGIRRDSFGFACGHAEFSDKGIVTVIDLVLEWTPKQLGKGKVAPVDIINVEDILLEIAKARQIQKLTFDHWQSQGSIQRLLRSGVPSYEMHFGQGIQTKMYELLRVRLNQGLVKIPKHPTLVEELKNLEMSATGNRVDHPKNKDSQILGRGKISKDLADCVAAVNWHIAGQERAFQRDGGLGGGPLPTGSGYFEAIDGTRAVNRINWGLR